MIPIHERQRPDIYDARRAACALWAVLTTYIVVDLIRYWRRTR